MFKPNIKKYRSTNHVARSINELNKALTRQANPRPGYGISMISGPFGHANSLTDPLFLRAKSGPGGIDGVTGDVLGRGEAIEMVIAMDGEGAATRDTAGDPFPVYSDFTDPIPPDTFIILAKIGGIWSVIAQDCQST